MRVLPTADGILSACFADLARSLDPGRRAHAAATECDLRLAIETGEAELLTADERVLAGLERQLDPIGAVARILPASALPMAVERFVRDPSQHPRDPAEARDRLEACLSLLLRLARDPGLVPARALRRCEEAIRIEAAALAHRVR